MPGQLQYIEAKSILSKLKERDTWFGLSYNMNLYRGCQHGCIYCDTRSECYGVGDIARIRVKDNAIDLLRRELAAKRRNKGTIGTGSMNDPYMSVEKETGLTRRAMEVIAGLHFPVHVLTKSDLILRDTDLLQEIAKTYAAASFTITTADDGLAAKLEPNAPPASRRFEAMSRLAQAGIYTGVLIMPMLPYLNDTEDNLRKLLQQAKDSGASYVLFMPGVTLRKGSREYFYRALENGFPGLKEKYENRYGDSYICPSPREKQLYHLFREEISRLSLAAEMNFYEPADGQGSLF